MTKNIRVTDDDGNDIGYTYPKRAKGLIKNGRAQYVDDCTIRLSRFSPELISEEKQMRYILLNPRDWSENNGVEHTFMDGFEGKLEEIIQLGNWNPTEFLATSKHFKLEQDTEYHFVFWLNGGENENSDEVCELLIRFNTEDGYTNRYKLNRNYIKPLLHHKGWELYSIEFNTPSGDEMIDVNFSFKAKKAPMAIKAAKVPENYIEWNDEPDEFADKRPQRHNIVFEDGWPSINMYGGNRYSTEILKKAAMQSASSGTESKSSKDTISFSFDSLFGNNKKNVAKDDNNEVDDEVDDEELDDYIDDLEGSLDDLSDNLEDAMDSLVDLEERMEDLIDRCVDNSFDDLTTEIRSVVTSQLLHVKSELSKIDLSEYIDKIRNVSSEADAGMIEGMLDSIDNFIDKVGDELEDIEGHLDDYEEEIDEREDELEDED